MTDQFRVTAEAYYETACEVLISKQNDYGPNSIAQAPGGPINGLRVRMHDKFTRINNLIDNGANPENESLRDSFLDLMNYAAIGVMVLDGTWPGLTQIAPVEEEEAYEPKCNCKEPYM